MTRRPRPSSPAVLKHGDHLKLWRLVEGAVFDAFMAHPDYLTDRGRDHAVESITKRVVGQLVGHAHEARKRRPLGASGAGGCADAAGDYEPSAISPHHSCGVAPAATVSGSRGICPEDL